MDISSLVNQVLASTEQSNKQMAGIADMMGLAATNEAAVAQQGITGARQDIGVGTQLAGQAADIDYQRSSLVQQLQSQAGLDPAVAENAYAQGLADLTVINSNRKATAAELTNLQSKNLFDDPFSYIVAQLNLPAVQNRAVALEQQAAVTTQDVNDRLNLLANAKSTVVANTADAVKKVQLETAALKARDAQRNLDNASAQTQSKLAADYLKQVAVMDKIVDNTRQGVQMQISVEQWKMSMAERQEARAERAARAAEVRADKETKVAAEASLSQGLRAASMLLGYPRPVDFATFKVLPNGPQKKALASIADTGTLGAGFEDSWKTLMEAGPNLPGIKAGGNEGFARFITNTDAALESYVSLARRTPGALGKMPNEKEARTQGISNFESDVVASMSDPKGTKALNSPVWDTTFNPYKAQYKVMASIADGVPALKDNVVVNVAKTMLAAVPGDVSNFRATDEQALFNAIGSMVAKKQINANDAAKQIATYYQVSAAKNLDMYQYTLTGIPAQNSYVVKVKVPGTFSDNILPAVNVMDETQAKKLLLTIAKAQEPASSTVGPGAVPPFLLGAQQAGQALGKWMTAK